MVHTLILFILFIIAIVSGCGVLCALHSILSTWDFGKQLDEFKLHEALADAKQELERKELLRQWLIDHRTRQGKPAYQEIDGKYNEPPPPDSHTYSPLYMRVYSLHRALADDNGARKLPQLHDLRELTMQDEMSRVPVVALRTIISVLLIVGIFGTLNGVHSVIGDWGEKSSNSNVEDLVKGLPPALMPSMLAVSFTVLLMWMRGLYSYFLQRYLLRLDQITMEKLLPRLQPESQTQDSHRTIEANIKGFADSMNTIAEQLHNLKNTLSNLKDKVEPYHRASEKLTQVVEQAKETATKLRNYQLAQRNALTQTTTTIAAAEMKPLANLRESADTIHRYKEAADHTRNSYVQLTDKYTLSLKTLRENMDLMRRLSDTAHSLPTYAEDIRKYVADLDKTVTLRGNIDIALGAITQHKDKMNLLADEAYATAQETQHDLTTVMGHLETMSGIESQYQHDLQSYVHTLDTTHEKLQEAAGSLKKANDALFNTFTQRKKTITTKS